jgi:shikimate dehydrogenase
MQNDPPGTAPQTPQPEPMQPVATSPADASKSVEVGGPPGPEPTRFGDWEKAGRCIDF